MDTKLNNGQILNTSHNLDYINRNFISKVLIRVIGLLIFSLLIFFLGRLSNSTNFLSSVPVVSKPTPTVPSNIQSQRTNSKDLETGMLIASGSAGYASAEYRALKQFKDDLKNVLQGNVNYISNPDSSDKEQYFRSEIKIPYQKYEDNSRTQKTYPTNREIEITARKYIPGYIAKMGYEGSEWEVNFDSWVQYLQKLTPQTTEAVRIDSWGRSEQPLPILVKRWGKYTFGIYDSYFKPAGNYDRNFVTYDGKNKQIIEVIARDYFVDIDYVQGSAIHKYNDVTEELYSSVEDALANIASQQ